MRVFAVIDVNLREGTDPQDLAVELSGPFAWVIINEMWCYDSLAELIANCDLALLEDLRSNPDC